MNIYALEGHKVRCFRVTGGYKYHEEKAKKYLELGKEYTVEKTEVESFHTDVYLKEIPNVSFNSTYFEDVVEQSEKDDERHPDYKQFN